MLNRLQSWSLLVIGALLLAVFGALFFSSETNSGLEGLSVAHAGGSSMYIKFDGVDGESRDESHRGRSEIYGFEQGIHQPGGSATGATRRRASATLEDIQIMKELDKSSPKLAESLITGKVYPKVEIHVTRTSGEEGSIVYYQYELKNVLITSYTIAGTTDSIPHEEFALNFEEIKVTYTEMDQKGGVAGKVEYSWNVEKGTK